jgi:hypothetical protein
LWATELGSSTGRLEVDPPVLAKTRIIAVSSFAMIGDVGTARATGCDHSASNPLAAMIDFSNSALAPQALAFFDDPRLLEAFLGSVNQEGPWAEYGRAPMPAELAFEIFFVLLRENILGYVDWDAGGDEVLKSYADSSCSLMLSGNRLHVSVPVARSAAILS